MKKKVIFGVAALLIVALVVPLVTACPAAPPPTKDKIRVGLSTSLSGPLAIIRDSAFRPIYEAWVEKVNSQGGLYVAEHGKKLPIELIIYDDKSDVGTMTRLTEKLIVEDKVDILWPACGTSMIFAQSAIANKYGYVLITAEGGATTLKDALPSLPYLFVTMDFSDWNQLPIVADLFTAKGAQSAFITYIADLHGIEYSGVAGIEFPKRGIKILGNVSLPPDLKDFAPVILEAMGSGADIFCCFAYPDQVMPATGTAIALGYNPKAFICGPGANFGFYHTAFGPAAEGVLCFAVANEKSSPKLKEFFTNLYAGKPEEFKNWWGHPCGQVVVEVWEAVIEKAGTLDQKKIRDLLATEKFETILGTTWFTVFGNGGGLLAKECYPGEIGQWQNGTVEIVGGNVPTADFVYPKPNWPAP